MVQTLTKPLTLVACLLVASGIGILSWWAWKGFDDTLQADAFRTRHFETLAASHVVHNLGAELFHLEFSFRLEVSKAIRDGETDWPRRIEAILKTYRSQAHYPDLLHDLLLVTQEGELSVWSRWTDHGWVAEPRPEWVPRSTTFDQPADPMIDLKNPMWILNLPTRAQRKLFVVIHYDLDTIVHQIVPDLVKKVLNDPQTGQAFSVEVHGGSLDPKDNADLRVPLVPRAPFSSWLQTYLERAPAPADEDLALGALPMATSSPWTLEVRLLPQGLAAHTAQVRAANLATVGGLMVLLILGFGLILALAIRVIQAGRRERAFTSLVSHELKTPVAAIRSLSENLSAGLVVEDVKVKQYGTLIEEQTQRLAELITNILTMASLEAPGSRLVRENFDALELIRRAGEPWGLTVSAEGGEWQVRGNLAAIRAALDSLVTNAFRYGSVEGQAPEVTLGLTRRRTGAVVWVGLWVSDRGPGLSRQELKSLFLPYRRGNQAQRRQVPGGGMGLYLVKATMNHLGGKVQVAGVPGGGLCCILWLRQGG